MSQNTSSAVMAQRGLPHDSLDHFPTPLWATRALCEHVIHLIGARIWEPACGCGAMVRALKEYATLVHASDVHDYGWMHEVRDFTFVQRMETFFDWVVTNPPFALAEEFVTRALRLSPNEGVAVLVRTAFIESAGRYNSLFKSRPPAVMAQFVERVPMVKGRLDRGASTATSYCWLIWTAVPAAHTKLIWIPPCRAKLERPGDWPTETGRAA